MLKVTGIEKSFKRKKVLAGASFEAEPGTCVGIVGGNGCGKTTLLSIVAGAARPDGGSVSFDGHEAVGHPRVYEKYAAYVPQVPAVGKSGPLMYSIRPPGRAVQTVIVTSFSVRSITILDTLAFASLALRYLRILLSSSKESP